MKLKPAQNKGFTLIEFAVSVSLITIITVAGVINFQSSSRRQQLETSAARIRQIYVAAKLAAESGKKNCEACGASLASNYACGTGDLPLVGWEVRHNSAIVSGATVWQFTTEGVCGAAVNPYPPAPTPSPRRFTIDGLAARAESFSNLTVVTSGGNTNLGAGRIVFRPAGGGLYPEILPAQAPFTIRISDNFGNSRSFTINGAGVISNISNP